MAGRLGLKIFAATAAGAALAISLAACGGGGKGSATTTTTTTTTTATATTTTTPTTTPSPPARTEPRTTRVSWNETWKVQGVPVLSFAVTAIKIGTTTWSAHISFRNLLHKPLTVPSNSFGIAFYSSAKLTPTTRPLAFGIAKTFSRARPSRLAPGGSWTGVISGPGRPKITGKTWARIVFGPFYGIPGKQKLGLWITDHSLVLNLGSKPSGPLVI